MLRYRRINGVFLNDTLQAQKTLLTGGNKYAQLHVSDKGFVIIYPMKSQSEFNDTFHSFKKR